jgi:hypothetical protein
MLGMYSFNNICKFLEDGLLSDIYKKEFLKYQNKPVDCFTDEIQKYYHGFEIKNTKYDFKFNHDFCYDISRNAIINYNFIMNEFDNKIKNFKDICQNDTLPIFINFSMNIKKDFIQIEKMFSILKKHMNKTFYIFIFLNENINYVEESNNENIKFIYLQQDFRNWWTKSYDIQYLLYKEIYEKYVIAMKKINIEENFVLFEELNIKL